MDVRASVMARPALKPALRRVWRDAATLQIGLDPTHALIVGDIDDGLASWLEQLDGSREFADALKVAADCGVESPKARAVLDLLAQCGAIEDAAADRAVLRELSTVERERLAPDLAALSVRDDAVDGGAAALARRRARAVTVYGAGRIGASIAVLLAAAGIGYVRVKDPGLTRPADLAPAGIAFDQLDRRRDTAAARAARRAAPSVTAALPPGQSDPDLAIVSPAGAFDRAACDRLAESAVPHLYAGVRELVGVVGPLVLPGRSSCLGCHDLHRSDRDPSWPRVAAQLAVIERGRQAVRAPAPCDIILATVVAAHAALHALVYLDGGLPPIIDGTIEIAMPEGRSRRRSWSAHPACSCGADRMIASAGFG
jgi:ThiF family